jgi:hypothetical protein
LNITKRRVRRFTEAGRIAVEHAIVGHNGERIALYHADDVATLALELCDLPPYVRAEIADRPKPTREPLFNARHCKNPRNSI